LSFFFQAEDGIRDWSVTGVQTCALPISSTAMAPASWNMFGSLRHAVPVIFAAATRKPAMRRLWIICIAVVVLPEFMDAPTENTRSEERRVGKECRARRSTED